MNYKFNIGNPPMIRLLPPSAALVSPNLNNKESSSYSWQDRAFDKLPLKWRRPFLNILTHLWSTAQAEPHENYTSFVQNRRRNRIPLTLSPLYIFQKCIWKICVVVDHVAQIFTGGNTYLYCFIYTVHELHMTCNANASFTCWLPSILTSIITSPEVDCNMSLGTVLAFLVECVIIFIDPRGCTPSTAQYLWIFIL